MPWAGRAGLTGLTGEDPALPAFSDRLPRPWLFPLLVFGLTWGLIVAAWQVSDAVYGMSWPWNRHFMYADGPFYLEIALHFYAPAAGHPPSGLPPLQAAFFPLFPLLIRAASYLTFHDFTVASLVAVVAAGAASATAVWALAARAGGRLLADRTVILYCAFPGAMALSIPYSEPLGVALAAASLLAALGRRWLLAGLLGLLATAEHPTLVVLAPALAVAAVQAIWARSEWRALLAPLLAPAGYLGYTAWMGSAYHDYFFLGQLESRYWRHHIDWGAYELHVLTGTDAVTASRPPVNVMYAALIIVSVIGVAMMIAVRVPLPVTVYTLLTVILLLITSRSGPKPRYVWAAFGIFLGAAAMLPRWLFWPAVIISAAFLALSVGWWPHHPVSPPP
jgi:hypothetical protein